MSGEDVQDTKISFIGFIRLYVNRYTCEMFRRPETHFHVSTAEHIEKMLIMKFIYVKVVYCIENLKYCSLKGI